MTSASRGLSQSDAIPMTCTRLAPGVHGVFTGSAPQPHTEVSEVSTLSEFAVLIEYPARSVQSRCVAKNRRTATLAQSDGTRTAKAGPLCAGTVLQRCSQGPMPASGRIVDPTM